MDFIVKVYYGLDDLYLPKTSDWLETLYNSGVKLSRRDVIKIIDDIKYRGHSLSMGHEGIFRPIRYEMYSEGVTLVEIFLEE
jgi:hypothetical protein